MDRGLATCGWVDVYPEAKILHEVLESDHSMLILDTKPLVSIRKRQFIYDPRWNKVGECRGVIKKNWSRGFVGSHAFRVTEKLKWVHCGLQEWRKCNGCNLKLRIDMLKKDLRQAYKTPAFANANVRHKEVELKAVLKEEERYWRLKSRTQWIQVGDKNTKLFHAQMVKRRRCNKIMGLEDDQGVW